MDRLANVRVKYDPDTNLLVLKKGKGWRRFIPDFLENRLPPESSEPKAQQQ